VSSDILFKVLGDYCIERYFIVFFVIQLCIDVSSARISIWHGPSFSMLKERLFPVIISQFSGNS
jgi:hypothetical protein